MMMILMIFRKFYLQFCCFYIIFFKGQLMDFEDDEYNKNPSGSEVEF